MQLPSDHSSGQDKSVQRDSGSSPWRISTMDGCQFGVTSETGQISRCSATWLSNFDLDPVMLRCRVPSHGLVGCSHDHAPDRACSSIDNEPLGTVYAMAVSYASTSTVHNPMCFAEPSPLRYFYRSYFWSIQSPAGLRCYRSG